MGGSIEYAAAYIDLRQACASTRPYLVHKNEPALIHLAAKRYQELCEVNRAVVVPIKHAHQHVELFVRQVHAVVIQAPLEVLTAT